MSSSVEFDILSFVNNPLNKYTNDARSTPTRKNPSATGIRKSEKTKTLKKTLDTSAELLRMKYS